MCNSGEKERRRSSVWLWTWKGALCGVSSVTSLSKSLEKKACMCLWKKEGSNHGLPVMAASHHALCHLLLCVPKFLRQASLSYGGERSFLPNLCWTSNRWRPLNVWQLSSYGKQLHPIPNLLSMTYYSKSVLSINQAAVSSRGVMTRERRRDFLPGWWLFYWALHMWKGRLRTNNGHNTVWASFWAEEKKAAMAAISPYVWVLHLAGCMTTFHARLQAGKSWVAWAFLNCGKWGKYSSSWWRRRLLTLGAWGLVACVSLHTKPWYQYFNGLGRHLLCMTCNRRSLRLGEGNVPASMFFSNPACAFCSRLSEGWRQNFPNTHTPVWHYVVIIRNAYSHCFWRVTDAPCLPSFTTDIQACPVTGDTNGDSCWRCRRLMSAQSTVHSTTSAAIPTIKLYSEERTSQALLFNIFSTIIPADGRDDTKEKKQTENRRLWMDRQWHS